MAANRHTCRGDGNCFFRAISDQLDGNENNHAEIRHRVCDTLEAMAELFQPFCEDEDESWEVCGRVGATASPGARLIHQWFPTHQT